jgi:hypothetical protein
MTTTTTTVAKPATTDADRGPRPSRPVATPPAGLATIIPTGRRRFARAGAWARLGLLVVVVGSACAALMAGVLGVAALLLSSVSR